MPYYTTLLYEAADKVGRITLNRPHVRNAINPAMEAEVKAALLQANADPAVRLIVLTGAAPAFCSGIDLKLHRGRSPAEARKHFESFYWGFHTTHRSLDKPTLAVLNGPAREAGCTMAFMCDMILAGESASIGFPAIDRGIVPAYHLIHLPRIMGRLKAFEICFSGDPISAREAELLGVVNQVVPDAELAEASRKLAARFVNKPAGVMKIGKELFYRVMDMEMEKAVRTVGDVVSMLAGYPAAVEGMTAFVEKRAPDWTDK